MAEFISKRTRKRGERGAFDRRPAAGTTLDPTSVGPLPWQTGRNDLAYLGKVGIEWSRMKFSQIRKYLDKVISPK